MSDMPDRIWAGPNLLEGCSDSPEFSTEYIRADLVHSTLTKILREAQAASPVIVSSALTRDKIISGVREYFDIPAHKDLRSESRERKIAHPRMIAMYLLHEYANLSFPQIGKILRRDHTTVLSGCRKVKRTPKLLNAAKEIVSRVSTQSTGEAA